MKLNKFALFGFGVTLVSCGSKENLDSQIKIIGGQEVNETISDARRFSTIGLTTDLPSTKNPENGPLIDQGRSFCTGTLIGKRTIVTAAHCLQKFNAKTRQKEPDLIFPEAKNFLASFGDKVQKSNVVIPAAKVIPHPDWSPADTLSPFPLKAPNDIGLIMLSSDAPSTHTAVKLASPSLTLNSQPAFLAGFGVTKSRNNNDTGILRWIQVAFSSDGNKVNRVTVNGGFGKGACAGDSGGPAYVKTSTGLELVGATSTGLEIAGNCIGLQNNYTDVRKYADWIASLAQ